MFAFRLNKRADWLIQNHGSLSALDGNQKGIILEKIRECLQKSWKINNISYKKQGTKDFKILLIEEIEKKKELADQKKLQNIDLTREQENISKKNSVIIAYLKVNMISKRKLAGFFPE